MISCATPFPEPLRATHGSDAGLRTGNGGYGVAFDFADEAAYRAWDAHPDDEPPGRYSTLSAAAGTQSVASTSAASTLNGSEDPSTGGWNLVDSTYAQLVMSLTPRLTPARSRDGASQRSFMPKSPSECRVSHHRASHRATL